MKSIDNNYYMQMQSLIFISDEHLLAGSDHVVHLNLLF